MSPVLAACEERSCRQGGVEQRKRDEKSVVLLLLLGMHRSLPEGSLAFNPLL